MAAIPRVIISPKMLTHHLTPTATLEISETAGGVFSQTKPDIKLAFSFFFCGGGGWGKEQLCVFCYIYLLFCGWIQLEINFAKVNCIILDALTSHI